MPGMTQKQFGAYTRCGFVRVFLGVKTAWIASTPSSPPPLSPSPPLPPCNRNAPGHIRKRVPVAATCFPPGYAQRACALNYDVARCDATSSHWWRLTPREVGGGRTHEPAPPLPAFSSVRLRAQQQAEHVSRANHLFRVSCTSYYHNINSLSLTLLPSSRVSFPKGNILSLK